MLVLKGQGKEAFAFGCKGGSDQMGYISSSESWLRYTAGSGNPGEGNEKPISTYSIIRARDPENLESL